MVGPGAFPGVWPVTLRHGEVMVRELRTSDAVAWREVRERNLEWLARWEATTPPGGERRPRSFAQVARRLRRGARRGTVWPYVIEVEGRFAGQVTVSGVTGGSAMFASVGYWVDRAVAGRGVAPRAVALVLDHVLSCGLHRVEVAVRPENSNSLRVVEKLGLHEVGFAPHYLHIDGLWRDHRLYAVTAEDWPPGGLLRRVLAGE